MSACMDMDVDCKLDWLVEASNLQGQFYLSHEIFFSLWLRNNEPEATKKHNASLPRREELNRLKKELCHKFDLADIRYCTVSTLKLPSDVH